MNVAPEIDAPARHLYLLKEKEGKYDAREQRSTPASDSPGGFTQVDNAAILDTNLSLPARMLYAILRQHRNGGSKKCCPAYSRLCDLLGTTGKPAARTTVARSLKELLDAGLVAWERHGRVNFYYFPGDPEFAAARAGTYESIKTGPIEKNSGNYGWQVMVERRDGGRCVICDFAPAERHHIVPRREKGPNLPENIATLCPNHHEMAERGDLTREELSRTVAERSSVGLLQDRSSQGLQQQYPHATPVVAHGYSNNMKLTRRIEQENSAPTERAAPGPEPAPSKEVGTPKQPTPTVEAKPTEREHVPRAKRASDAPKPSGDAFGLVGWLLKEQGGIARAEWQKVADAKAADAVVARLGGVEAAREHATARLMETRRTTLLWAHILEDVLRAAAARQRGVVERRATGPAVSAADGFGAVARRARGEEEDDDQGRDGRVAATTFDGVARPL